jgi:hypothetical protein
MFSLGLGTEAFCVSIFGCGYQKSSSALNQLKLARLRC